MKVRFKMKRLLAVLSLCVGVSLSAGAQKVSLEFTGATVAQVLSAIKTQTKMDLVFSDQVVDVDRTVTIHLEEAELEVALEKLLEGTQTAFEIRGGKIYLVEKNSGQQKPGGKRKVTGLVVDAAGEPAIGVSVAVVGTSHGAITDLDGRFTLDLSGENTQLRISYVGYKS